MFSLSLPLLLPSSSSLFFFPLLLSTDSLCSLLDSPSFDFTCNESMMNQSIPHITVVRLWESLLLSHVTWHVCEKHCRVTSSSSGENDSNFLIRFPRVIFFLLAFSVPSHPSFEPSALTNICLFHAWINNTENAQRSRCLTLIHFQAGIWILPIVVPCKIRSNISWEEEMNEIL